MTRQVVFTGGAVRSGPLDHGAGPASHPLLALEEVQAAVRALRAGQFRGARPTARPLDQPSSPNAATDLSADPQTETDADIEADIGANMGAGPGFGVGCLLTRSRARRSRDVEATDWAPQPGERVLAVIGSSGSCGASTVALAVALSANVPARVIECCSSSASGLAAATTAELGLHPGGWQQGRRDQVLIERTSEVLAGVDEVPTPASFESGLNDDARTARLTVLDVGWEVGQLTSTDSWSVGAVANADQLLLVTTATVPGIRRLEGALELLVNHTGVHHSRIWVAVLGPRRKKWPRGLEHAGGPHTRRALSSDRVLQIPEDRALSIRGLDSRPLPPALMAAAAHAHTADNNPDGRKHHVRADPIPAGDDSTDQLDRIGHTGQPVHHPISAPT